MNDHGSYDAQQRHNEAIVNVYPDPFVRDEQGIAFQCWICPDCHDDVGHRDANGLQVRCGGGN